MLFSVKKKKRVRKPGEAGAAAAAATPPALRFLVDPAFVAPDSEGLGDGSIGTELGVLDLEFTRTRPTYVELLLRFPEPLAHGAFVKSLRETLAEFPAAAGRREGACIIGNGGVRFSAVAVDRAALMSRPPSTDLFDMPDRHTITKRIDSRPDDNQVLTLRVSSSSATNESTSGQICGLGIVFDHALCDIGGVSNLLAHVSYKYSMNTKTVCSSVNDAAAAEGIAPPSPPASPTHLRENQSLIQFKPDSEDCTTALSAPPRLKGGVACVDIIYCPKLLHHLKAEYKAVSRHEATYTDIVMLLQSAGQVPPVRTATLSRDDRQRSGLGVDHFGNGAVMLDVDFCGAVQQGDGCAVAACIRAAISEGVGRPQSASTHTADVHLNTWWHPLQRDLSFGLGTQPSFSIGPGSLCASGQICVARGGQPNVTVLPESSCGGLRASLLAPLRVAYAVQRQIAKRERALGLIRETEKSDGSTKDTCESKAAEVCRNFARGRCRYGSKCPRLHVTPETVDQTM